MKVEIRQGERHERLRSPIYIKYTLNGSSGGVHKRYYNVKMVSEGTTKVVMEEVIGPTSKANGCSYYGGGEGMCYCYCVTPIMPAPSSPGDTLKVGAFPCNEIFMSLVMIFLKV